MANAQLFNCSQCGHIIAASAPTCVGCGTPGQIARNEPGHRPSASLEPQSGPPAGLIDELPTRLERVLADIIQPGEEILVKLKGAFTEALICTDRRVMIVKAGFMAGVTLGSNVFQVPYRNITGAQVCKHWITGYFELSAGGVQNQPTSYWGSRGRDAQHRENCVSINRSDAFARFNQAGTFILSRCGA
jgi:hypothetical protein